MLFAVVKFTVRPERNAEWLSLVEDFAQATRAEPGNVFFEVSKSVDNPHQYLMLEGFADLEAGEVHRNSEHFKTVMAGLPDVAAAAPEIISTQIEQNGWSSMG